MSKLDWFIDYLFHSRYYSHYFDFEITLETPNVLFLKDYKFDKVFKAIVFRRKSAYVVLVISSRDKDCVYKSFVRADLAFEYLENAYTEYLSNYHKDFDYTQFYNERKQAVRLWIGNNRIGTFKKYI